MLLGVLFSSNCDKISNVLYSVCSLWHVLSIFLPVLGKKLCCIVKIIVQSHELFIMGELFFDPQVLDKFYMLLFLFFLQTRAAEEGTSDRQPRLAVHTDGTRVMEPSQATSHIVSAASLFSNQVGKCRSEGTVQKTLGLVCR